MIRMYYGGSAVKQENDVNVWLCLYMRAQYTQ
uniref:Uncharacterized protein n=1 Tax=Arundo donax TaxID=35708 RepID=A0A0A9BRB9_ARUDO